MTQFVNQIMHAKVRAAGLHEGLPSVAHAMKKYDIGAIPVVDDGAVVGVITDRDIALRAFADGRDPSHLQAKDVMSSGVATCLDTDSVSHAIDVMTSRQVRRLPVVNKAGSLVGILTLGDAAASLSNELSGQLVKAVTAHHS